MPSFQNDDLSKYTQHLEFKDKIVLVTGAARGIGKAIALAFADQGARIAIHYNTSENAAKQTLWEIYGGPHLLLPADLTDPEALPQMVDRVVERFGRIDVLVNNAAVIVPHHPADVSYKEWRQSWQQTVGVNLISVANLSYCVAQQMIKQGGGKIVNVSSRGAFRGEPGMPAYGASKAGLNAMGQSLAQALAPHNIFVGTVAPGFVETDRVAPILNGPNGEAIRSQSPFGRVARATEVAQAVVNLCRPGMEFTSGCILDVNGASYLRT